MKVLIVVDYQNDFVDGSLGFKKAEVMDKNILNVVKKYLKNDIVIFTLDTHKNDYLKTEEGKNLKVKHCIKGTLGHSIYGTLGDFLEEYKSASKNVKNKYFVEMSKFLKKQNLKNDIMEIENYKNVFVIEKETFGSKCLLETLRFLNSHENIKNVEIMGIATNICVISNAVIAKSALPNAHIVINEKCTNSYDAALHKKAIDVMKGLQMECK